jgi:predicted O-linked N-acetylglucosamine transferase (SPINDLY family)
MSPDEVFAAALGKSRAGDHDAAAALYRQLLSADPRNAWVHYNLGISYRQLGRLDEAVEECARALALKPDFPEAENNLGSLLRSLWRIDEAIEAFRRAVTLRPRFAEAWNNLGVALRNIGMMDDAVGCFERSIELQPHNASLHSNYLHALHYKHGSDPFTLRREHRLWNERHAAPLKGLIPPHANGRSSGRRLRIGYVSAAFREHCQSFFTVPLFSHHDHDRFEIVCYSDTDRPDALTARLEATTSAWRNTARRSDEEVAQAILDDRIDILVDLMLHTSGNRLLVFARKPAPIQVTWLGYPGSTGLDTMDYRLTDPWLDPRGGDDGLYSERSYRLPGCFWCYDPLAVAPAASELPALRAGHVTLGCLNNFSKVNDPLLRLWARILQAVPDSRLLLLCPRGEARSRVMRVLNVGEERVEFADFQPRRRYLESYQRIDLCLDTFPYNGHTTSLDAFWLGVPVVSLCGQTPVSRAGLSHAANLELPGLVAADADEYVRMAAAWAGNPGRLAEIRSTLRERMAGSPLMDGASFARNVENAYQAMWRDWCDRRSAEG